MITTLVGMEFRRSDICERLFHRSELETHSCMRTNRASASTLRCQFSISVAGASSASALIKKLSLPNSSYITNTFDSVSRVLTTKLNNSSHSTLNSHAYVYNPGHQRTKQTRTDGSYVDYTYDTVSELQSGKGYTSGGSPISTEQMGYKYDPGWNLNQRTNNGSVQTFTVDNQNQLTSDGVNSYSYDSNGNLISKSWSNPSYGSLTYTYDDENQLASVATDTSYTPDYARWKVEFVYDGRMRRRVKKEYTWNSGYGAWQLSSETRYVYDGNLVIQERNSSNTPTVQYTRGTDLSGSFEGAGGIGGMLSRSTGYSSGTGNWSTHHHYHADGNGNITAMVDSGQSLSASYKYDPYGKLLTSSGTQAGANLYRFSSKEFHVNSGLYYYGYRFYDPNIQRWMNRDPLYESVDRNLFRFNYNSPIQNIDANGLWGVDVRLVIGIGVRLRFGNSGGNSWAGLQLGFGHGWAGEFDPFARNPYKPLNSPPGPSFGVGISGTGDCKNFNTGLGVDVEASYCRCLYGPQQAALSGNLEAGVGPFDIGATGTVGGRNNGGGWRPFSDITPDFNLAKNWLSIFDFGWGVLIGGGGGVSW
jgi:RHS repeat-associated protein